MFVVPLPRGEGYANLVWQASQVAVGSLLQNGENSPQCAGARRTGSLQNIGRISVSELHGELFNNCISSEWTHSSTGSIEMAFFGL